MFKKLLLTVLLILNLSLLYTSTSIEATFGVMGASPKNEFKNQGVPLGLGFDFNGIIYPVNELGFGLNINMSQYGRYKRSIPYYFSDLVTMEEKTKNNILGGHLFFKLTPFNKKWNVQPYIEGLIGFKNLITETTLYNENGYDDPDTSVDEREISASTNANDAAFSYGYGVGIDVLLKKTADKNQLGELFFFINARYLLGAEAEYLKQGDIIFSDPADGPVVSTFNWNKSTTDLLNVSLGLSFRF